MYINVCIGFKSLEVEVSLIFSARGVSRPAVMDVNKLSQINYTAMIMYVRGRFILAEIGS